MSWYCSFRETLTWACRGVVPPGPASADEIDAWAPGRFRDGDDAALADVDLGA